MPPQEPLATLNFHQERLDESLEFLKRTRGELRTLRKVRIWLDRLQIFDVNGDYFELHGIGYTNSDAIVLLQAINTAFKPELLHQPIDKSYKEFKTGRRHPWAEDRVM